MGGVVSNGNDRVWGLVVSMILVLRPEAIELEVCESTPKFEIPSNKYCINCQSWLNVSFP